MAMVFLVRGTKSSRLSRECRGRRDEAEVGSRMASRRYLGATPIWALRTIPFKVSYSEVLSALALMILNVIMSKCFQSIIGKIKHSKLKEESPEAGPRIHVEPANRSSSTDDMDVQNLWTTLHQLGRAVLSSPGAACGPPTDFMRPASAG